MGTRSLLGIEVNKDKIHTQYMQFDGYPSVKGYDYYMAVLETLLTLSEDTYTTKKGKPTAFFRSRGLNFLNEYQYASGHSIGNNFMCTLDEFDKKDCWQEWQYLFRYNGDFDFFNTYGSGYSACTIPWEATKAIAMAFDTFDIKKLNEDGDIIRTYFEAMDEYEKNCTLVIEAGKVHAFPEQKQNGWRGYGVIKVKVGNKIVEKLESMFADKAKYKGKRKDIEKFNIKGVQ